MKKQHDMHGFDKPDKPKIHDFTSTQTKSSQFVGILILIVLAIVGGFLLFNWRQVGIPVAFIGLLFFGVGVFAFVGTIYDKFFVHPKEIIAQLVSIDNASEHLAGFAQYVLKYQDANGKVYTFYKNDIYFEDIELNHAYKITVQGSQVKKTGDLMGVSTHSIVSGQERKSLNYMSGIYCPTDLSFREMKKIEMGFMVILIWFTLLFFLLQTILDSIVFAVPAFLFGRWLYADYVTKVNERDKPDEL